MVFQHHKPVVSQTSGQLLSEGKALFLRSLEPVGGVKLDGRETHDDIADLPRNKSQRDQER